METNSRSSSYFLHLLPRESIFRSELLPIRGRRIDFWDSSRSHSTFVSKTEKKLEKNKKTRKEKRRRILIVNAAMNPVFGEGGKEGEYQSWNERFPKIKKKERKKWTNGNRLALVTRRLRNSGAGWRWKRRDNINIIKQWNYIGR